MIQMEKTHTQSTLISVHPSLKDQKIDEDNKQRVRQWTVNASFSKEHIVASYEVIHQRNIHFFKDGPTPSYVGLGLHFGADTRYFDKRDLLKTSLKCQYEPTENGLPRAYASIPKQPNHFDCGVYVIKFMECWSEASQPVIYYIDILKEFLKEIMLEIVMGPKNSLIEKALMALDDHPVRRNQPRNKRKEWNRATCDDDKCFATWLCFFA
ncbi:hypothetical protein AHAS_Ahas13G0146300 [Arachis hypogaea]